MIGCHKLDWCVMRTITDVRYTVLGEVTLEECQSDGFGDNIELKDGLKNFYPNIDFNSPDYNKMGIKNVL